VKLKIIELGVRAATWFDGCQICRTRYGLKHRPHCPARYGPQPIVTPTTKPQEVR
jgi:hypothetical protein